MRTRPSATYILTAVALVALVLVAGGAAAEGAAEQSGAAGWQGLLGSRPVPQLGGRWIVVLRSRSLADRVRGAGAVASERRMKAWTALARQTQRRVLARLAFRGAPIQPEYEYVRVLNAFAASIDTGALPVIERDPDVAGVYPVRAAYPAATGSDGVGPSGARRQGVAIPGFDGSGVTVALLDTGVDYDHPYTKDALLPGLDIVDPGALAQPGSNPTEPGRVERHGTELTGLLVGTNGPGGLRGVAPGARVRPIRVAGWQPDTSGGVAVYARTDQLLAGLEAAVDPNGDGDAHDAARIALVGLVEPFDSFADAPLVRAAAGALALDTLVVAPAGNDGPAGPTYGSVGAPAAARAALSVAAADTRQTSPTAHVLLRTGLRVLLAGEQPLGGAVATRATVTAPVIALSPARVEVVGPGTGFRRLFDANGYSRVAGTAPLLPTGPPTPEAVAELAAAGARAVLVDGPLPAGALGISEPLEVPVLGLPTAVAQAVRTQLASGRPVELAVGAASVERNGDTSTTAAFSSEGLTFADGAKPEISAAGVGLATSEPGRSEDGSGRFGTVSGSSAAAAVVAGAAAVLAQARPDLDAAALRSALVAAARPLPGATAVAAGFVDASAAASVELVSDPPTVGLGAALEEYAGVNRPIRLRNVSRRPLTLSFDLASTTPSGVTLAASPPSLVIGPGRAAEVEISGVVPVLPRAPGGLAGVLRVKIARGGVLRVPWAISVPVTDQPLLAGVRLSSPSFAPSDAAPAVLTLIAGRVDGRPDRPQLLPLKTLQIDLYRDRRRRGRLARLRDVLPGRYAFGITGRGPRGALLPPGAYALRVVATPVGGGERDVAEVEFGIR